MSCDIRIPELAYDANKYTRGKLTVVAGSERYPGAAVLAARAAQRMGAGYVEVITHEAAVGIVRSAAPSLVVRSFSQWEAYELPSAQPVKPCAVCIGPGFVPETSESRKLLKKTLKAACCPVVIDGGALAALADAKMRKHLVKRSAKGYATVVTPHGGEAARLSKSLGMCEPNAADEALGLARELQAVVALKGPDTYISDGQRVEVMTEGTPALAKAGTGDVLAGMIGSLLAQGLPALEAAYTGATLHARAGRVAAERFTEIGICPEDVIDAIPQALNEKRGEGSDRS